MTVTKHYEHDHVMLYVEQAAIANPPFENDKSYTDEDK